MVEIKIGVHDRAVRNLLVLTLIPIVTAVWLWFFLIIYLFASTIVTGENQAWFQYFAFLGIFIVISVLEFFAIIYIKLGSKNS